jgi:hypothetical protein
MLRENDTERPALWISQAWRKSEKNWLIWLVVNKVIKGQLSLTMAHDG